MFPIPDLGDDLFYQPKTMAETLHSDSDLRNDIFAHAVEMKSKFQPKRRINNNRIPAKNSKTSASEGPSFTSKFHDAADYEHVKKFPLELQGLTSGNSADLVSEYSQLDSIPLHDESFDAHGPNLSADDLNESLENEARNYSPIYSSEKRASCGNINDLKAQSLTEIEDLHTMDGGYVGDHIEDSNLVECAPNIAQNDETEKSSRKVTQGSKKLNINVDNVANIDQNTKNTTSEINDDYGDDGFKDDDKVPMFPIPDLGDDLFYQRKTMAETLHSDSDLRNDTFAPATIVVAERRSKFQPKLRINNNRILAKNSKTSASEGPSSTSKFHDAVDGISDEHAKKFPLELQGLTSGNSADLVSEYSQLDSIPLHDESFDAHGPNLSAGALTESLENEARSYSPIYSSEERACCGNINDLKAQSLPEIEDLHTMDGGCIGDHIEDSNLVECAPNIAQSDETEKSSRKDRQGSKKLKINVDNVSNIDQNTKNTTSEIDDDYGDDGYKDDDIPKQTKRKLPRKSTSRSSEHKSSIKNNKGSEEPGSTVKDPPKKSFPHGSSRCRSAKRQVNKAFVEIPDDELDRRKLVLRDLIRLAGFKERVSTKEAAALKNSFANKSVEHEQDLNGEDANEDIQQECPRLNYHSYMRRPLQTRWSKADTETFYQAIRQFGTDFEMIQVLFPVRSRQQVKAKFKNEQRKHPLQIADALVHRGKDHSHFEKVIQHLQAMAEQNSTNDASDPTAQSQDEADQNEEEKVEDNSNEEQDVNC